MVGGVNIWNFVSVNVILIVYDRDFAAWNSWHGWSAWSHAGQFPCDSHSRMCVLIARSWLQYPIPPGGNFTYKFSVKDEYGFYWYHSHVKAYYNDGLRGPLFIRPSSSRPRPFEALAHCPQDREILLQAEKDAQSILLNDWTHDVSDTIYNRYFETGAFPHCVDSILANGFGRVECLPEYMLQAGPGLGLGNMDKASSSVMTMPMAEQTETDMNMDIAMHTSSSMSVIQSPSPSTSGTPMSASMDMPGMAPSMTSLGPRGCMPPMMFKPGYNASSLPPETCTNTSSPLLNIPANHTNGWLALNLVNSGAVSKLRVSLDAHTMFVYAADGLYVEMQEVKVGIFSKTYALPSFVWINHMSIGPGNRDRSTIFCDDSTRSDTGELLPQVCNIPRGWHATSAWRTGYCFL